MRRDNGGQRFLIEGRWSERRDLNHVKRGKVAPVLEKLSASDLPNLWKPRPDQFFHIDALPYLGTGKLDLWRLRKVAYTLNASDDPN